ncbi:MAG: hypothetical protein O2884_13695 [Chloroflexi bacterium]|nr:hypothetical protein [Chloroflexota bacterium]
MDVRKVIAAVGINLAVFGALAFGPISADDTVSAGFNDSDEAKYGYGYLPGWGYGDDNHEHGGPPGLVGDEGSTSPTNGDGEGDEERGRSGDAPGHEDDDDNDDSSRGRSGDAPGRQQDNDDDEPGRSGDAPGRGKNKD